MGRARISYQPALDGLRAFAVGAVILYHLSYGWAGGGFLGVDAFFVLSGFLITSLLLTERERWGHIGLGAFWSRRARRLLPALFLLLTVVVAYGSATMNPIELDQLRGDALASLFYVANWHFIATDQSYFALFTQPSPLQHLWSLAIEEQFYLLWPLVVVGVLSLARGSRRALGIVTFGGILASQTLMSVLYDASNPSRAYYGTEARAHTLLVGCLLAILLAGRHELDGRVRRPLALCGVVAFAGCVVAWSTAAPDSFFFNGGDLAFSVLVAVVIASSVQPASPVRALLSLRPLRYVGRISYGLYLWHWPVIVFVDTDLTGLDGQVLNALRLAVTVGCTLASYYVLERPILGGALRPRPARLVLPAATVSVLVLVLVGTAGAEPTPKSLNRVIRPPGPCGDASPSEHAQARAELRRLGLPAPDPRAKGFHLLVIGDSRPCSLLTGLEVMAETQQASVANAAVLGCGVVEDAVGKSISLLPREFALGCHDLTRSLQLTAIDQRAPDAILWWSGWEAANQDDHGEEVVFGTPRSDALLLGRMEHIYRRLHRRGVPIVILSDPAQLPAPLFPVASPSEDAKHGHLSDLYRQFAARHPGRVVVIDFARYICPGDPPCQEVVDGIRPRPADGVHLSPQGAGWAAHWLWPQILDATQAAP